MGRSIIIRFVSFPFLLLPLIAWGQGKDSLSLYVLSKDSLSVLPGSAKVDYEWDYDVTFSLEGRTVISRPEGLRKLPRLDGEVSVEIKVNRYGEVSLATVLDEGTTITDEDIVDSIYEDVLSSFFDESANAPVFQYGIIVYRFFHREIIVEQGPGIVLETGFDDGGVIELDGSPSSSSGTVQAVSDSVPEVVLPVDEHLEFKKIPIDGPLTDFTKELRSSGFNYRGIRDGIGFLDGTFAGINNARIFVFSMNGQTYKVVVDFPVQDTWPSMKKQYIFFKNSYTSKYFSSPQCVEKFPVYIPEGSGREHVAFKEETAQYVSFFDVPNGQIVLSVQPVLQGEGKFFLRMEYIDEKNSLKQETAALEDI